MYRYQLSMLLSFLLWPLSNGVMKVELPPVLFRLPIREPSNGEL